MDKMFCCMVKLVELTMEVHYVHDTHIFCVQSLTILAAFFQLAHSILCLASSFQ